MRYFIARNRDLAKHAHKPNSPKWTQNGFMSLRAVKDFEDHWELLDAQAQRKGRTKLR